MSKITLPSGKRLEVVSASKVKVGAYRRMRRLNGLMNSKNPDEKDELTDLVIETVLYLIPDLTVEDVDDVDFSELNTLIGEAMEIMGKESGAIEIGEEDNATPLVKKRGRKKKTT